MTDGTLAPPADAQRWLRGWRRLALDAGLVVYPLVTAGSILQRESGSDAVIGLVVVGAFAVCYGFAAAATARGRSLRGWLGLLTVLFLAALPYGHADAFFLAAVVLSLAVQWLRTAVLPLVAVAAVAAVVVPWAVRSWHSDPGWTQAVALVFTVLLVYAFAEAFRANIALVEARAELVRLTSEAERARISRDLHDLLGHSLTAVIVKSTLARRLVQREPDRAEAEMAAVETLARQTLADVRAAVSGHREVTLAGELARARELLRASGVTADLPTATDVVESAHHELFGWVVREGVTNVARHARATRCTVRLGPSEVEVLDDGAGAGADWGTGLSGLRERVAAAGGQLEAGPGPGRGWRLKVVVP